MKKDCNKMNLCCKIPAPIYELVSKYSKEHYLSFNDTVSFLLINGLKEDTYFKHFYFRNFNAFGMPDLYKAIHFLGMVNRLKEINDVSDECLK